MGIKINNGIKMFGNNTVIDNLNLNIEEEKFTVLLGASGSGKTTILRLIAGLEKLNGGEVFINDKNVTEKEPHDRNISMVFQSYALFPHLNVRENIIFGLKIRKESKEKIEKNLKRITQLLNINNLLNRKPSQLSGGQKQRVALARAIISGRKTCLMDEPLSNLDARLRENMRREIRNIQKKLNLTVVYVTHDQIEAMSMADKIILINNGKIEQEGTPNEIYDNPLTIYTAKFIGTPPMNIIPITETEILNSEAAFVGIRPEDFTIGKGEIKVCTCNVKFAEYHGHETVYTAEAKNTEIAIKTDSKTKLSGKDRVTLFTSKEKLHFFNKNGKSIKGR